ncbi:helix-turn-helix domain-containing protein [Lacticaseibacillus paracasei]|uniref:helix-turn-helix domain-containing protein n=1 Tax=Lacticaseibacillus paracasei TaxID=1597 RepID=UPI001C465591|nr:helix-turn-helix domain-containing protein [Lacticaseibacillus paracasei]QXJ68747.1 helix-turn-helix domain-containing protein [Lacticaseibacillus paracasei subsp. paracasei]
MNRMVHVDIQEIVKEENVTHDWRLLMVLEGQIKVAIFQTDYKLVKDNFIILNPNERFSISATVPALILAVTINATHLTTILPDTSKQRFWNLPMSSPNQTSNNLAACRRLLHRMMITSLSEDVDEATVAATGLALMGHLRAHYLWHEESKSIFDHDQLVNTVITKLETEYAEDISLRLVADEMHVSYNYLSKKFKEQTHLNFNRYLNAIRLRHVELDLKYTDKSITQIGIDNGFLQPRTMARNFQDRYGMSPQKFRHTLAANLPAIDSTRQVITLSREEALVRLAGQLAEEDLASIQPVTSQQKRLDVQTAQVLAHKTATYTVNVGDVLNLNNQECVTQLNQLTEEMPIAYIRVFGVSKVRTDPIFSTVVTSEKNLMSAFYAILAVGAQPIIRLSVEMVLHCSPEDLIARFEAIAQMFGKSVVRRWIIEFEYDCLVSDNEDSQTVISYFLQSNNWQRIGVHVTEKNFHNTEKDKKMNLGNRFVYLSCDYLFLRTEIKEDLSELKSRLDSIQERLAPDRQYAPEIALDDWNTLAGNDAVTVGTFFRSALIKEILRQNNGFDNVSFWLSITSRISIIPDTTDECLSLFLYGTIRRPVYFVVRFLDALIGERILSSPWFSCYRNGEDYTVLFSNPTYIDPRMSISDSLMQYQSQELQLQLVGLRGQRYRIVSELLDKDCGGIYNQWLKVGAVINYSPQYIKYLATMTQPRLKIEDIATTDGKLVLSATQSFNSMRVYRIRPLND